MRTHHQIVAASAVAAITLVVITTLSSPNVPLNILTGVGYEGAPLGSGTAPDTKVLTSPPPSDSRLETEADTPLQGAEGGDLAESERELPEEEPDESPRWKLPTGPYMELEDTVTPEDRIKEALIVMEMDDPQTELGIEYAKDRETIIAEILMNIPPREATDDDDDDDEDFASEGDFGGKATGLVEEVPKTCDLVNGSWVTDKCVLPYSGFSCRFIPDTWNCDKRQLSVKYQRWRWKPHACELPWPFQTRVFLDLMRGKTMWIVGDPKVDRSFAYSLACAIEAETLIEGHDDALKGYQKDGQLFYVIEYGLKIRFVGLQWLVKWEDSIEAFARYGVKRDSPSRVLVHVDTIDKPWVEQLDESVDVLVLSSGQKYDNLRNNRKYYVMDGQVVDWEWPRAYRQAMQTVASALQAHERFRGVVVYKTYSPVHFSVGDPLKKARCGTEDTLPADERDATRDGREMSLAIERDIFGNSDFFHLLDITEVSDSREDAHVRVVDTKKKKKPKVDCINWCVPGVPDTWSALLHIILDRDPRLKQEGGEQRRSND